MRRLGFCAVLAFVSALVPPAAARAEIPIDIKDFTFSVDQYARDWGAGDADLGTPPFTPGVEDDGPSPLQQAGAHPNVNLKIEFCNPPHLLAAVQCYPSGAPAGAQPQHHRLKDMIIGTPPGLVGNPRNLPFCEYADFLMRACSPATRLGFSTGFAGVGSLPNFRMSPAWIYNVRPIGSELARFGAIAAPTTDTSDMDNPDNNTGEPLVWQPTLFSLRSDGDFGLDALSPNFPPTIRIGGLNSLKIRVLYITLFGHVGGKPFISNPTQCNPDVVTAKVNSHEVPGTYVERSVPLQATGCENVPFDPAIDVTRETDQAGAASGYTVGVNFADSEQDAIHESHLKDATVKLPEGVALAAPAARDLAGCTEAQFGHGDNSPIECPAASNIGDVNVFTPVLDADSATPALDPLKGRVFFAAPTDDHPWRILMAIEDAGLLIKLIGDVEVDENTGQITTTFKDNPQTPFTRFELKLRGGDNAVLQNPVECGTHTVEADFAGWANPGDVEQRTFDFDTTGCTTPRPFAPTVPDASTSPTDAGASTISKLVIDRPDGHQLIKALDLSLPGGLVGRLTGNPLCPAADAKAGTCSAASKVGKLKVDVGAGNAPLRVGGEIFLSEPFEPGDAAGLSIVVPAKTGPIDLGKVVTTNRVMLRKTDGGINVKTGELPKILKGVHLPIRRIEVLVDREGFFQNPTSCAPKTLVANLASHEGGSATANFTAAATNCDRLPFSPRLEMTLTGELQKGGHPALRAVVTQGAGESGIAGADVLLPQVLRPDVPVLNRPGKLCNPAQLDQNACPAPSNIGTASVHTPLLPEPLTGPVFIVQDPGSTNPLPRLVVRLGGRVSIDLLADNKIKGVRTQNIFSGLPDVPQSRFELNIVGGHEGILKNFSDICDAPDTVDSTFIGHSGKLFSDKQRVKVPACKGGAKIVAGSAKVNNKGVAAIPVSCSAYGGDCDGKLALHEGSSKKTNARKAALGSKQFSIAAGESKRINVKLSRKARRKLTSKRKLKATAVATAIGKVAPFEPARASISLSAPKRKKGKRGR